MGTPGFQPCLPVLRQGGGCGPLWAPVLHIIDPLNRTGKIDIPADVVVPTLGAEPRFAVLVF